MARNARGVKRQSKNELTEALLRLAQLDVIDAGDLPSAFTAITEAGSMALSIARSSIWLYSPDHSALVCQDLYERSMGIHLSQLELTAKNYPQYFAALQGAKVLAAHDAVRDPATREFAEEYLKPLGISSMLDVPIWLEGKVIGVVCNEHIGAKRRWSSEEQFYANSLADVVSRAIMASRRAEAQEQLKEANSRLGALLQHKILQEQQQEALAQSSKLAALGEVAGSISHEINNPITIIQGRAQQMRSELLSGNLNVETFVHHVETILNTTKRVFRIIKSIRGLARDGRRDPFQACTLGPLIGECAEMCELRFQTGDVKLEVLIDNPHLTIECRPVEFSQVLVNLLNNAFDAVKGLESRWVKVEVQEADAENVQISVTDSGSGIAPDILEKIMTPFFTTKPVGEGTGLGLSITKSIIDSHGGSLYVDSESANTRFVMIWPKRQRQQKAA